MFPLIRTVPKRDYTRGTTISRKNCKYKGENPNMSPSYKLFRLVPLRLYPQRFPLMHSYMALILLFGILTRSPKPKGTTT